MERLSFVERFNEWWLAAGERVWEFGARVGRALYWVWMSAEVLGCLWWIGVLLVGTVTGMMKAEIR